MIYHLNKIKITVILIELNKSDVISILPNFGDLIFEVEVSKLSYVACFEVINRFADREDCEDEHEQGGYTFLHTCELITIINDFHIMTQMNHKKLKAAKEVNSSTFFPLKLCWLLSVP